MTSPQISTDKNILYTLPAQQDALALSTTYYVTTRLCVAEFVINGFFLTKYLSSIGQKRDEQKAGSTSPLSLTDSWCLAKVDFKWTSTGIHVMSTPMT